ncbi:Uncharacterised protein [Mycobacteroides abscessus subsp. abscessus]|nr:Uncharacterised protein [Mycobacteroides abscessus subsp. abscessus]
MTEGDDVLVIFERPVQHDPDFLAIGDAQQYAMAPGDEDRQVVRIGPQGVGDDM